MTAPITFFPGRIPNDHSKARIELTDEMVGLATYTPPASINLYQYVEAALLGMDGNDKLGDCTIADVDHEVKVDQGTAGNTILTSTEAECIAMYSKITGYTPKDPNSDQGAEMQAVREYWMKTGFTLGDNVHKILLFAEVAPSNVNLIKWCIDNFGALGLGLNFPSTAMDQFNQGQPWSVVNGATDDGGHAVAGVGYDADFIYVVTWGAYQKVTWQFFAKYFEEAWVVLSEDFINAKSGNDYLGRTFYALGQAYAGVTGKPNPIAPPVTPTPAPTPTPTPTPVPPVTPPPVTPPATTVTLTATADQIAVMDNWSKGLFSRLTKAGKASVAWKAIKGTAS